MSQRVTKDIQKNKMPTSFPIWAPMLNVKIVLNSNQGQDSVSLKRLLLSKSGWNVGCEPAAGGSLYFKTTSLLFLWLSKQTEAAFWVVNNKCTLRTTKNPKHKKVIGRKKHLKSPLEGRACVKYNQSKELKRARDVSATIAPFPLPGPVQGQYLI